MALWHTYNVKIRQPLAINDSSMIQQHHYEKPPISTNVVKWANLLFTVNWLISVAQRRPPAAHQLYWLSLAHCSSLHRNISQLFFHSTEWPKRQEFFSACSFFFFLLYVAMSRRWLAHHKPDKMCKGHYGMVRRILFSLSFHALPLF